MPEHATGAHDADLARELRARISAQDKELMAYREREGRLLDLLSQQGRLLEHKQEKAKKVERTDHSEPESIDVEGMFKPKKKGSKKKSGKKGKGKK